MLLSPLVEIVRPIPPIAWIPLSLLWFGFGNPPAYFLTALGAFFPMMSATHLGFAQTEVSYTRAATSLGIDKRQTFLKVILPQALPSIVSGARVGIGVAWMIVVTAELVGAQSGLGYMIQISRAQLQSELVIGGMLVIGVVGFTLSELVSALEHMLTPWRFRGRETGLE
jgi:NitT/TauT family transport system permease protein